MSAVSVSVSYKRVRNCARRLETSDKFHSGTFLRSSVSAQNGIAPPSLFDVVITTMKVYDFQDTYIVTVLPWDCSRAPQSVISGDILDLSISINVSCHACQWSTTSRGPDGSRITSHRILPSASVHIVGTPIGYFAAQYTAYTTLALTLARVSCEANAIVKAGVDRYSFTVRDSIFLISRRMTCHSQFVAIVTHGQWEL